MKKETKEFKETNEINELTILGFFGCLGFLGILYECNANSTSAKIRYTSTPIHQV